jgi:hypothetical protein
MKICPKFAQSPPRVALSDPGFHFGTLWKILIRQQDRYSLLARGEQHQSQEIDQLSN